MQVNGPFLSRAMNFKLKEFNIFNTFTNLLLTYKGNTECAKLSSFWTIVNGSKYVGCRKL